LSFIVIRVSHVITLYKGISNKMSRHNFLFYYFTLSARSELIAKEKKTLDPCFSFTVPVNSRKKKHKTKKKSRAAKPRSQAAQPSHAAQSSSPARSIPIGLYLNRPRPSHLLLSGQPHLPRPEHRSLCVAPSIPPVGPPRRIESTIPRCPRIDPRQSRSIPSKPDRSFPIPSETPIGAVDSPSPTTLFLYPVGLASPHRLRHRPALEPAPVDQSRSRPVAKPVADPSESRLPDRSPIDFDAAPSRHLRPTRPRKKKKAKKGFFYHFW
jgi:hypothetical protein